MAQKTEKGFSDVALTIHQYYMDILNCLPNIVYWIDLNCELKGSNHNFVKLLGLNDLHDFKGTPYKLLEKYAQWSSDRVESFKLDDMSVIFSGKARTHIKEAPVYLERPSESSTDSTHLAHDAKQEAMFLPQSSATKTSRTVINYLSTRVPLFDKKKEVVGLVVILMDLDEYQSILLPESKSPPTHIDMMASLRERSPRILMVEDNLIAQKVEQALMIQLGCDVDVAESGEIAQILFNPGKYDVVLMDIGLQDTSGYIVAKKLREKEKGTDYHVPIIALTSYQADVVKYDCRDYFMDGVITKPLTQEQAQQIIDHYVYHKEVSISGFKSG